MKAKTLLHIPTACFAFILLTGYPRYTVTSSYPFYKIQRHLRHSIPWVTKKNIKESPQLIESRKSLTKPQTIQAEHFINNFRRSQHLLKNKVRQGASITQTPRGATERKRTRNYGINGCPPTSFRFAPFVGTLPFIPFLLASYSFHLTDVMIIDFERFQNQKQNKLL